MTGANVTSMSNFAYLSLMVKGRGEDVCNPVRGSNRDDFDISANATYFDMTKYTNWKISDIRYRSRKLIGGYRNRTPYADTINARERLRKER